MIYSDLVFKSPQDQDLFDLVIRQNSCSRYANVFSNLYWRVGNSAIFDSKQEALAYFMERLIKDTSFNSSLSTEYKFVYKYASKHKNLKLRSLINNTRYDYDKGIYSEKGARGLLKLLPVLENYLEPTCAKNLSTYLKKEIKKLPPPRKQVRQRYNDW